MQACIRPLRPLPHFRASLVGNNGDETDKEHVSNAWMAAPRRHPFFWHVLHSLPGTANLSHPLQATGPRFMTFAWDAWKNPKHKPRVQFEADPEASWWRFRNRSASPPGRRGSRPERRGHGWGAWADEWAVEVTHNVTTTGIMMRKRRRPCGHGSAADLARCLHHPNYPNMTMVTFWTATWAEEMNVHRWQQRQEHQRAKSLAGAAANATVHVAR